MEGPRGQARARDRFIPAFLRHQQAERLLSTTLYRYANETLLPNLPDRSVRWAYAETIDTYLYDASQPALPGEHYSVVAGGDLLVEPAQQGAREHLRQRFRYDANGNLVESIDEGRPDETGPGPGRDGGTPPPPTYTATVTGSA